MAEQPRSKGGFALGDYVEVKDRIKLFYDRFPEGALVTDRAEFWLDIDPPRVVVKALAYRTPDDQHPGVGWSWLTVPGQTPYTRGSELENAETSAWGRAIGSLGIGIDKSIASKNEVDAKAGSDEPEKVPSVEEKEGGLIGVVSLGKSAPVDGQVRETPRGNSIGFVIGEGREKVQVVAYGDIAESLALVLPSVVGQRVQVYGPVTMETMRVGNYDKKFPRLALIQMKTDDWKLPAAEGLTVADALALKLGDRGPDGDDDDPREASPEPMFPDADEEAAIIEAEFAEAASG